MEDSRVGEDASGGGKGRRADDLDGEDGAADIGTTDGAEDEGGEVAVTKKGISW